MWPPHQVFKSIRGHKDILIKKELYCYFNNYHRSLFLRRIKWSWHMMKSVSLTFCYCLVQRKLLYTSSCGFEPGLRYYLVVILAEQNFYLSESLFRQWQKYKKTLTHSTFTPFLHWRNSYARSQMSQLEILTIDKNFELVYMSVRYTLGSSLICHDT